MICFIKSLTSKNFNEIKNNNICYKCNKITFIFKKYSILMDTCDRCNKNFCLKCLFLLNGKRFNDIYLEMNENLIYCVKCLSKMIYKYES